MPRKVAAWACSWGCHRHVLRNRKEMEAHEAICFHNPARRACQTCGNFATDYATVYDPYHGGNPGSSDWERLIEYCRAGHDVAKVRQCDCTDWTLRELI